MKDRYSNKELLERITKYFDIIAYLQSDKGCPWDRDQTVATLIPHLQEELYEVLAAFSENNDEHLAEELGDLCLVVYMMLLRGQHEKRFSIEELFKRGTEKLIRRHPHVFGPKSKDIANTPDKVKKQWDKIKRETEKQPHIDAPTHFHPFERSFRIQKQVAKLGFDWKDSKEVVSKMQEELTELDMAKTAEEIQDELGDVLFVAINLARKYGVSPTLALHHANEKFIARFEWVLAHIDKEVLSEDSSQRRTQLDKLWEEAKTHV